MHCASRSVRRWCWANPTSPAAAAPWGQASSSTWTVTTWSSPPVPRTVTPWWIPPPALTRTSGGALPPTHPARPAGPASSPVATRSQAPRRWSRPWVPASRLRSALTRTCPADKQRYFTVCLKNPGRLKGLIQWLQSDANKQKQMKINSLIMGKQKVSCID